jgi:hypothetical protein
MLRLSIGRRLRMSVAVVGVVLMLGVVVLDAHADLPEHHHHHGVETVCVAALAIATLAAMRWGARAPLRWVRVYRTVRRLLARRAPTRRTAWVPARAGPPGPVVLRR